MAVVAAVGVALVSAITGCGSPPPDDLDPRAPDLLSPAAAWEQKQMMMMFLGAIENIERGLAEEDWSEVRGAAAPLGIRPGMQCPLGTEPRSIEDRAHDFRCRGRRLQQAAEREDLAATRNALVDVLQACNACHTGYRQVLTR